MTVHRITSSLAFPSHDGSGEFHRPAVLHEYDVNRIELDWLTVFVEEYYLTNVGKVAKVFRDIMLAVTFSDLLNATKTEPSHVVGLKRPRRELPDVLLVEDAAPDFFWGQRPVVAPGVEECRRGR